MGAGVVAAGVSAALIAGADTASADTASETSNASVGVERGDRASTSSAGKPDAGEKADRTDRSGAITRGQGVTRQRDAEASDADSDADVAQEADDRNSALAAQLTQDGDDESAALTAEEPAQQSRATSETFATAQVSSALGAPTAAATTRQRSLPDVVQGIVFDVIGVAVTAVAGPPVVAPGTNVTVRSSTLQMTAGHTVPADWYYPAGEGTPERLIYLQHGFLGVGAMYSYTASYLADRTNSVVVVPTLSSNRYVRDGFWLGDDQVYRATADLLLGDREALTASAVAAGFADRYGPDAALPETFVLVGHSLGAGVAAGAAGYYADAVVASGATNQLAGIVLLDGAPPATVLPDALVKLDRLGEYIPVFELGAPKEARRVDAALVGHRPGYFNGVVLDDGQHLDAMQGGTPAIQFISYLYQGFPTEQNKSAAQTIIAGWANDIFAGRIDPSTGKCAGANCAGVYANPGQPFVIDTPVGPASGVAIGIPVVRMTTEFQPTPVNSLISPAGPASGGVFRLRA